MPTFHRAFQKSAFQNNAFQILLEPITDTDALQLPINCVMAGQQLIRARYRENDIVPMRLATKTAGTRSGIGRLKGGRPSFTVTTGKRGYD